jgi:hypothetical protein
MSLINKTLPIVCGAVLCIGVCSAQIAANQRPTTAPQTTLNQVLSWLPPDTETVIGANGPFPLPDLDALANAPNAPPSDMEWQRRMESLPLFLFDLKNGGLTLRLQSRMVTLAVEGSRHFRPPAVLGGTRYEGCMIVLFDGEVVSLSNEFLNETASTATRVEKIAGFTVAVFEEEQENDIWTTFVAFPQSNVVTVATSEDYLRVVLERIGGATEPRALPSSLPEWKFVDTLAHVWGLRHYAQGQAGLDPTSPFQGQVAANIPDAAAVGGAFSYSLGGPKTITVTYVSGNSDSRKILQGFLMIEDDLPDPPAGIEIRFRQPEPGAVQYSVSAPDSEVPYGLLFGLLAMLGHAIYL